MTAKSFVSVLNIFEATRFAIIDISKLDVMFKDLNSTVAKRGSVFIGLMTPNGAIWFRYQRAVLIR